VSSIAATPAGTHYHPSADSATWRTGIPPHARLRYRFFEQDGYVRAGGFGSTRSGGAATGQRG
jgi:hypothetical protein